MNKKKWSIIGLVGLGVLAIVKAVLDKAAEKVVDQYYSTEGVGGFVTFLASIPSWFMQSVSVPLLVLIMMVAALVLSLGYVAWMIYSKRFDKEVSKAKLPAPKPELIVTNDQRQVLKVIADATNAGVPLTIRKIFDFAGMDQLNFDHALNELQINGMVRAYDNFQKGRMVTLTPVGIKFVLDENLAHKKEVGGFGGSR
jgi:predicted transcriptional regulator